MESLLWREKKLDLFLMFDCMLKVKKYMTILKVSPVEGMKTLMVVLDYGFNQKKLKLLRMEEKY